MNRYLITGATGYIGSMLAKKLISDGEEVHVIARDPSRLDRDIFMNAEAIQADLADREAMFRIKEKYDYIIHCAAPTRSSYMVSNPVEVIDTIVNGTGHILNLAERCNAKSVVYLSSMEVYGQIDCPGGNRVTEEQMGYLNVSDARSCYPLAKLTAENLCHACCKEYGVPVKIARLSQTFGRGVRPDDGRVYAQFARAVREGRDIVLHTSGGSIGNYCSIDDTVEAILFILANGADSEAYNVVNEANTMSIRDMAEMVAQKIAGGAIKVVYDIPSGNPFGYAASTGLRLSGGKLRKLGWQAKDSLEEMYRKMIDG